MIRALSGARFFVEPNVAFKSARTGSTNFIGLVAEDADGPATAGVCVKTTVPIETYNNDLPLVLLAERPSTPNSDWENYIKFGLTPEPCPFYREFHVYEEKNAKWDNLFAQYCAISRPDGAGALSAMHPEGLQASLLALAEYTEAELNSFNEWTAEDETGCWRAFFWQPTLVVSGQLMTAQIEDDGSLRLIETPLARLEFNWHDEEQRRTTVIEIVREDFLLERVEVIRQQDNNISCRLRAYRTRLQEQG